MLKCQWCKYRLDFKFVARTSRNEMRHKDTYFLKVWDADNPNIVGYGECNLFAGLSADDVPDYELALEQACKSGLTELPEYSSILFGTETALADLQGGGRRVLFDSAWVKGASQIPINGLVWMGDKHMMLNRIQEKLDRGFRCLKLKIGGIDFDDELELLSMIRREFPSDVLELRLDANGAFNTSNALRKLEILSKFSPHSIEQPIPADQPAAMARLCQESPIDIALDEELIGVRSTRSKAQLLDDIKPKYIILKPALCGGFAHAEEWIKTARERGIGWWATSALESSIGLNAIAQWVASIGYNMPQGLGTGQIYRNNIASPIIQEGSTLQYDPAGTWNLNLLNSYLT